MDQQRLFKLAVEDIAVGAHFEPGRGWRLHVGARRQDETWKDAHQEDYEQLSTPELVDVLLADLAFCLGL